MRTPGRDLAVAEAIADVAKPGEEHREGVEPGQPVVVLEPESNGHADDREQGRHRRAVTLEGALEGTVARVTIDPARTDVSLRFDHRDDRARCDTASIGAATVARRG